MADTSDKTQEVKRLRIRKYPNRRYYDSTRSRHLTLEEIYAAIREGYEVEVTDSKSGQDITAKVLAQMIIELDAPKLGVFPVPLLHRLLRANEQLVTDFTQKYFNQALDAFLDSQKKFEQSLRNALGLKSATPTVADWAKMMWGPFNPATWGGGATAPTNGTDSEPSSDVGELRRQVQELQRELADRKPSKSVKATKKKR